MAQVTKQYLTVQEMATIMGTSPTTIRAAIARDDIPTVRIGMGRGGAIRVRIEVFEQWRANMEGGAQHAAQNTGA